MKNKCKDKEVIAVSVISYNAEETIIETLSSILKQSYGAENIELIIADDHSTDNTCQTITDWLNEFSDFFYSTQLVSNDKNSGVARNINLAWKSIALSAWVKTIAADDILDEKCIDILFDYATSHSGCDIVFSNAYRFKVTKDSAYNDDRYKPYFYQLSPHEQYQELLLNNCIFAPTSFIKISLLKSIGYADERFSMIEDLPLWLKITKKGIKLHGIDINTVYYRLDDSVSHNLTKVANVAYLNSKIDMYKILIWPELKPKYMLSTWDKKIDLFTLSLGVRLFNNKRSKYFVIFSNILKLLSPLFVYQKTFSLIKGYNK